MQRIQPGPGGIAALLRWSWLIALIYCGAVLWSPLQAQTSTGGDPAAQLEFPDNLTREQVRDLVARLSDTEVRELIIAQLDKQAVAPDETADPEIYMGRLREGIRVAMISFARTFSSDNPIRGMFASIWSQLTDSGRISAWYLLMQLAGLMLAGWASGLLLQRLLRRTAPDSVAATPARNRLDRVCYDLVTGLLKLAAFFAGAYLFVEITSRQMPEAQLFWNELIWCLVLLQLVALAVRELAAPEKVGLLPGSAHALSQMLAWSVVLSAALILPQPLVAIAANAGGSSDAVLLLAFVFSALFVALVIVLLIRLRRYGAALILGNDSNTGSLRQALARSWWMLAIVYVLVIWLMSIGKRAATGDSSMLPGIGSLVLLVMIPFIDRGLKALVTWYFAGQKPALPPVMQAETAAAHESADAAPASAEALSESAAATDSAVSERAPAYIATALRYARSILALSILMIFVHLWDIDVRALTAQFLGARFASALFDIGITVLLTWALWGMIRISIERKLDEGKPAAGTAEGEAEAGGLGGSRVETVLPLIRVSIKITLVVIAILISLSALGVNIGPLIAGAGVVGIAVGFGAQTLVRDIVSGFFYLIDDAFRIGEYVVIDQIRGTVEKISVRSFQLRHHNGPVHTIPYGEIRSLTNWSRDWAIMKFELRIPFETDIEQVRKIIKKIGQDMMEDPTFGPLLLAPLKSQGVNRMDDSALIIRCKFTAIPGQQYLIRREAFTRIQKVFEEKGIQFAPRRVLVEATTHEEAVKAAAGALDQEKPPGEGKPADSM